MVRITNEVKLVLKLRELNSSITNKDLSELTNIPEKNISRYLKNLEANKLITRNYESKHQLRQCFNILTKLGKEIDLSLYEKPEKKDISKNLDETTNDKKIALNSIKKDGTFYYPLKSYKEVSPFTFLIDEFEQLKTYFRKGERPSQIEAIKNFEKHLKELKEVI